MEMFMDIAGCSFCIEKSGQGPALVLVHGIGCDHRFFDMAAGILSGHFTVITYDRRGYGSSRILESAGEDYSLRRQTEDLREILDHLGINSCFLCGTSAGSLIALEFAMTYPERTKRIALYEPPLAAGSEEKEAIARWNRDLQSAVDSRRMARAMLVIARVIGNADPESTPLSLEEQAEGMTELKVFLHHEMNEFLGYTFLLPGKWEKQLPMVLGAGSRNPNALFSRSLKSLAFYFDCPFYSLPACHNIAREKPELFAGWLTDIFK